MSGLWRYIFVQVSVPVCILPFMLIFIDVVIFLADGIRTAIVALKPSRRAIRFRRPSLR